LSDLYDLFLNILKKKKYLCWLDAEPIQTSLGP